MTSLIVTKKCSKPRVKILSPKSGNLSYSRSVSLCSTNYHSDHFDDDNNDDKCINNDDDQAFAYQNNCDVSRRCCRNYNNCQDTSNAIDKSNFASKSDVNCSDNIKDQPLQRHVLAVIDGNRTDTQASKSKSHIVNNLFVKEDQLRNDTSKTQILLNSSRRSSLSVSSIQPNHSRSISLLSHDSGVSHHNNNNKNNNSSDSSKKKKNNTSHAHTTIDTKSRKTANDINEINFSRNVIRGDVSHRSLHKDDSIIKTNNCCLPSHKSQSREKSSRVKNTTKTPASILAAENVQITEEQSKSHHNSTERIMLVQSILQKAGEHVLRKNLSAKYAAQLEAQQQKAEHLLTAEVERKRNRNEYEENKCGENYYDDDDDENDDEAVFYLQRNNKMQNRNRRHDKSKNDVKIDDNQKVGQRVDNTSSSASALHNKTNMFTNNNASSNNNHKHTSSAHCRQNEHEEHANIQENFDGQQEVKALSKYDEVCPGMFCGLSALTIPSKLFANTQDEVIESNKVNSFDLYKRGYTTSQNCNKSDNLVNNTLCKVNDLQQCKQVHSRQRCCVRPV